MPIYEFRCTACDARFDQLVRASDVPACPYCESPALERQMSAPALSVSGGKTSADGLPMAPRSSGGCCGGSCCH